MRYPTEINSRLLAHIGGDAFIAETGWEGSSFGGNLDYLLNYLNSIELSPALNQLFNQLNKLAENNRQINQLYSEEELGEFVQDKASKINQLSHGEYLDLPGGWNNANSDGHSILYRFSKPSSNTIRFEIVNSGGGISYHYYTSVERGIKYSSIKSYTIPIPEDDTQKDETLGFLASFIGSLLIPSLPSYTNSKNIVYSKEYIYEKLIPRVTVLGAVEQLPDITDERIYTTGQLGGTCSEKIIHQLLKKCFNTIDEYKIFMAQYILYASAEYLSLSIEKIDLELAEDVIFNCQQIVNSILLQNQVLQNQVLQNQVLQSVKQELHNLNLLLAQHKQVQLELCDGDSSSFQQASLRASVEDLEMQFEDLFHEGREETKQEHPSLPAIDVTDIQNHIITKITLTNFSVGKRLRARQETPIFSNLEYSHVHRILSDETSQLLVVENWLTQLAETDEIYSKIELTKNFLLLAANDRFFEAEIVQKDKEYLEAILTRINSAHTRLRSCFRLILPETNFINLCLLLLKARIITRIDALDERPEDAKYNIYGQIYNNLRSTFRITRYSFCSVTYDPEIDMAVNNIERWLDDLDICSQISPLDNYQAVIDAYPDSKKILLEKYKLRRFSGDTAVSLHANIHTKGHRELWYALENLHPTESYAYMVVARKIKQIKELELESCKYHLNMQQYDARLQKDNLTFVYEENQLKFLHPSIEASYYYIQAERNNAIFPRKTTSDFDQVVSIHCSQKLNTRKANEIQLKLHEEMRGLNSDGVLPSDVLQIRNQYHLRSSKELQRILAINYYYRNTELLAEEYSFNFLKDCLFSGYSLFKELKPSLISQVDRLIIKGLQLNFKTNQPTLIYTNFISLAFHFNRYLAMHNNYLHADKLADLVAITNEKLSILKAGKPKIAYKLNLYKFMSSVHLYKTSHSNEQSDLESFISQNICAYFYINNYTTFTQDECDYIKEELNKSQAYFQYCLRQLPIEFYASLITDVLASLGINYLQMELELNKENGQWLVKSNNQLINVISLYDGRIYNSDFSYLAVIPNQAIKISNKFKLGINPATICYKSDANDAYYFNNPDIEIQHLESKYNKLSINKLWRVNKQESWYNLFTADVGLPKVLSGTNGDSFWSKCNEDCVGAKELLITQDQQVLFASALDEDNNYAFFEIDADTNTYNEWKLILNYKPILSAIPYILRFEHEDYIIATQHKSKPNLIKLKLARYGLNLIYDTSTNVLSLADTDFVLCPAVRPFRQNTAYLAFENSIGQRKVILAIQSFIIPKTKHIFKRRELQHDTTCEAISKALADDENTVHSMQYEFFNSEQYTTITFTDNALETTKSAVALYLTYIYLSTRDFEKAFNMLYDCENRLGGLTGDVDELRYILMIVKELKKVSHPKVVACQVLTLAMLTEFLLSQSKFSESCLQTYLPDDSANLRYAKILEKKRTEFLNELPNIISHYLLLYLKVMRHLDKRFILNDKVFDSLITYYKTYYKGTKHGALAYFAQLYTLKKLLVEKHGLEKIDALSRQQAQRLAEINNKLAVTKVVSKHSVRLEKTSISMDFKQSAFSNATFTKAHESKAKLCRSEFVLKQLSNKLINDKINTLYVESRFLTFLEIICDDTQSKREILRDFCKNFLIANMSSAYAEEPLLVIMINILYRTSCLNNYERREFLENVLNDEVVKLERLIDFLQSKSYTPIEVLEPINVYNTEMFPEPSLNIQQIIAKLECRYPLSLVKIAKPHKHIYDLFPNSQIFIRYIDNKKAYFVEFAKLKLEIKDERITTDNEWDYKRRAGAIEYKLLVANQELAEEELSNRTTVLEPLLEKTKEALHKAESTRRKQINKILNLADERELSFDKMIKLYIEGDLNLYIKITKLSPEQIVSLDKQLHQYLHTNLRIQHLQRLEEAVQRAIDNPQELIYAYKVLTILTEENHKIARQNRRYTAIQYLDSVLLRTNQVKTLKALNPALNPNTPDSIEKITPGGGKTTYIMPLWANTMADGQNLVIIEVPKALLHPNYNDARYSSMKWFGQTAIKFDFSRECPFTLQELENTYELLATTIVNRSYIVTCSDAMRSLYLRCIETIDYKPESLTGSSQVDWQQRAFLADKILQLLASHGYALLDEVHKNLDNSDLLIFTSGKVLHADQDLINLSVSFYLFLSKVTGWTGVDGTQHAVTEIFHNPNLNPEWDLIAESIYQALSASNSPFKEIVGKYTITIDEIIAWIRNDLDEGYEEQVVTQIAEMDDADKNKLNFYKAQLNQLQDVEHFEPKLQRTIYSKHMVKYGQSQDLSKDACQRAVARPYGGNNVPRENSRYACIIEAINYTIQSFLITGIPESLIASLIAELKELAHQERAASTDNLYLTEDTTSAGQLFVELMLGDTASSITKLSEVDADSAEHIKTIHKSCCHNPDIAYDLLRRYILTQVTFNSDTLGCNAHQHVDIYKRVQGLSATPNNHNAYHNRLTHNPVKSLAEDGLVVEAIIQKNVPLSCVDYDSSLMLLQKLISDYSKNKKVHAIIDACAMIQGISNEEVATYIARHINNVNPGIRYVLYFVDKQLWAMPCTEDKSRLAIGTTTNAREIASALGCGPEEYFTYYDHVRTTGTNIAQAEDACALTLIDHKTKIDDAIQATMRMRGFIIGKQRIEYIMPTCIDDFVDNLPGLIDSMIALSVNALKTEVFMSGLDQLTNIMRNYYRAKMFNAETADEKHASLQESRKYYFETHNNDYLAKHGRIIKKAAARAILSTRKDLLVAECGSADDRCVLARAMDKVIRKTLTHCAQEQLNYSEQQDKAVEEQLQVQQLVKHEQQDLEFNFDFPNLSPYINYIYPRLRYINSCEPNFVTNIKDSPFTENFYLSNEFALTYAGQKEFQFDETCKYAHVIYFNNRSNEKGIFACLLTIHLLESIKQCDNTLENEWFEDASGTPLYGERPSNIDANPDYLRLTEQLHLFNADIEVLADKLEFYWLRENYEDKIAYFEQSIRPYRGCNQAYLRKLKSILRAFNQHSVCSYINMNIHNLINGNIILATIPELRGSDNERQRLVIAKLIECLKSIKRDVTTDEEFDVQSFIAVNDLPFYTIPTISVYVSNVSKVIRCMQNFDTNISQAEIELICNVLHIDSTTDNLYSAIITAYLEADFIGHIDTQHIVKLLRYHTTPLDILKSEKIKKGPVVNQALFDYFKYKEEGKDVLISLINHINTQPHIVRRILTNQHLDLSDEVLQRLFVNEYNREFRDNHITTIVNYIKARDINFISIDSIYLLINIAKSNNYFYQWLVEDIFSSRFDVRQALLTQENLNELLTKSTYNESLCFYLIRENIQLTYYHLDNIISKYAYTLNFQELCRQNEFSDVLAKKFLDKNNNLTAKVLIDIIGAPLPFARNSEAWFDALKYAVFICMPRDEKLLKKFYGYCKNNNLLFRITSLAYIEMLAVENNMVDKINSLSCDKDHIVRTTNLSANFFARMQSLSQDRFSKILNEVECDKLNTYVKQRYQALRSANYQLEKLLLIEARNRRNNSREYIDAIETTFKLHRLIKSILNKENITSNDLKILTNKINESLPKLKCFRGIEQALLDILNAVFFIFCSIQYAVSKGKHFRLFVAYSEPEKAINSINAEVCSITAS